jgi:Rad3-related DNA helicase
MDRIVSLVAHQFGKARGNYLLFAGSYEYLRQVEECLRAAHPEIPVWAQRADMRDADRRIFADRFVEGGAGIGLAVLGGSFSEGIDLPGSRLIGAFVLTLGLPAIDPSNEEARKRFEQTCGRGYEYAYLYPGLQKVVQAAGRVIRSTADRGFLFLLDDRYALPEIANLLPAWWDIRSMTSAHTPGAMRRSRTAPPSSAARARW